MLKTPKNGFVSIQKEKQRQACTDSRCGFCGCVTLSKPSNYSFALTRMSFRDLPLVRYNRRPFFKKILSHIVAAKVAVATTGPAVLRLFASLFSFENRQCCKLLERKVDVFSQFRTRWATFLIMRHNHKNHIGSPCRPVFVFSLQITA